MEPAHKCISWAKATSWCSNWKLFPSNVASFRLSRDHRSWPYRIFLLQDNWFLRRVQRIDWVSSQSSTWTWWKWLRRRKSKECKGVIVQRMWDPSLLTRGSKWHEADKLRRRRDCTKISSPLYAKFLLKECCWTAILTPYTTQSPCIQQLSQ